jgi:hypothetical protein
MPGASQRWQGPAHADSQQNPPTQKPEAHWLPVPQVLPGAASGWQTPRSQANP